MCRLCLCRPVVQWLSLIELSVLAWPDRRSYVCVTYALSAFIAVSPPRHLILYRRLSGPFYCLTNQALAAMHRVLSWNPPLIGSVGTRHKSTGCLHDPSHLSLFQILAISQPGLTSPLPFTILMPPFRPFIRLSAAPLN